MTREGPGNDMYLSSSAVYLVILGLDPRIHGFHGQAME